MLQLVLCCHRMKKVCSTGVGKRNRNNSDNQTSGSTEMNKGKSKDKNTKANIASTPTPQDSDSDDTDSESVNATLASIISDYPSSHISYKEDAIHVFLATNANFMTHSE